MAYTSDNLFRFYDDDMDDDHEEDRYLEKREDDEWECCFPDRCLVPHYEHRDEG